jgi:hypothetical protein
MLHGCRQTRKSLGHLNSRHRRVDRRERPANIGLGAGLGVEGIDVAGAAIHPKQDAVFALGSGDGNGLFTICQPGEPIGEQSAKTGSGTSLEHVAPGESIADCGFSRRAGTD